MADVGNRLKQTPRVIRPGAIKGNGMTSKAREAYEETVRVLEHRRALLERKARAEKAARQGRTTGRKALFTIA